MRAFKVVLLTTVLWMFSIAVFGQGGSPIVIRYGSGCDADLTQVTGLNNRGEVSGYIGFGVPDRGFIYRNGNFFISEYQKAHCDYCGTRLFGINNRGEAVGWFLDRLPEGAVTIVKALLLDASGTYHVLAPRPGEIYAPNAINDAGDTAGFCDSNTALAPWPCMRTRNGKYFNLSKPPAYSGYEELRAVGINNRGLIAADLFAAGETATALLATAQGTSKVFNCKVNGKAVDTTITAINNKGQVIGSCSLTVNSGASFVRDSGGSIRFLQLPPSLKTARFLDLNDHGDAIADGYSGVPFGPGQVCAEGLLVPNVTH